MVCLGENTVTDLVESLLAPAQRAAIDAHTAECEACRKLISELVRRSLGIATGTPVPPSAVIPTAIAAGTRVGRYVVKEQIGKGAMGAVYAAHDPELDRTIAIKLLHPGDAHRERIQREARALAKLSHPNVVTALDLGELDGDLALAMELVEGTSLDAWMKTSHSTDEVLDAFRQAGRGLAAAHDAGLVHRDFKPENVVVGSDGRVRVVDFGLAAGHDGGTDLVGTPAYMAPEQLEDGGANAASDQFAFCVSLYQALHGVRPFAVNLPEEMAYGPATGPAKRKMPPFAAAALERGLHVDPAKRFPSMTALLAALSPRRMRTRTRVMIGAVAITAVVGATAFATRTIAWHQLPCRDAAATFAAIWNPQRADALHARFTATGVPFAETTWRAFDAGMTKFGERWIAAQTDACEATNLRGEQSDHIFTLRSACLAQALAEGDALVAAYANVDRDSIEHVAGAIDALPSLAECANVRALLAPVPLPTGRDAAAVAAVTQEIAVARALRDAAMWPQARAAASKAVESARTLDHPPTRAAALYARGEAEEGTGAEKEAEATLREAYADAEVGHDDVAAARIAAELVYVVGTMETRYAEGLEWAFHADTALKRAGGDLEIESRITGGRGGILWDQDKYEDARVAYQTAYDLKVRAGGANSRGAGEALSNLSRAMMSLGDNDKALELANRAKDILEAAVGPNHPEITTVLSGIGSIQYNQGKWTDALASFDRAIAIAEARLGPEHLELGRVLGGRGMALTMLERPAEAVVALDRAVKIFDRPGGNQQLLGGILAALGDAEMRSGHADDARASYQRAIKVDEAAVGSDSEEVAAAHEAFADFEASLGHHREALAEFKIGLAIRDKIDPPEYVGNAHALAGIGDANRNLGDPAAAVEPLRRSVKLLAGYDGDPTTLADTRLSLARAIWDSHGDRDEARALAVSAADALAAMKAPAGSNPAKELAAVQAWQRAHP